MRLLIGLSRLLRLEFGGAEFSLLDLSARYFLLGVRAGAWWAWGVKISREWVFFGGKFWGGFLVLLEVFLSPK